MDFVDRLSQSVFGTNPFARANPATLLKFTDLDPRVQRHLAKVYVTLAACLVLCTLGCGVGLQYGGVLPLTQLVAFGCMLGLAFTPPTPQNLNTRYGLLGGFSLAQGCSLTPLVAYASAVAPGVVLTAMLATAAVFTCFTVSALMTRRRTYLFLGGYLASAVMGLFVLRLGSWLFRSQASAGLYNLELYGGLLIFSGYVLFDTQMIVEKAAAGADDHIRHAQDLLVNILAIFVRVLIILIRNAQKKAAEEERRRSSSKSRR